MSKNTVDELARAHNVAVARADRAALRLSAAAAHHQRALEALKASEDRYDEAVGAHHAASRIRHVAFSALYMTAPEVES